jgi:hypothetical protein
VAAISEISKFQVKRALRFYEAVLLKSQMLETICEICHTTYISISDTTQYPKRQVLEVTAGDSGRMNLAFSIPQYNDSKRIQTM